MTGERQEPEVLISAIDQIPVILMICEGPELRVAGLNAATRALIPGREALGRPLGEVIHELDGQRFLDAYQTVQRTGVPATGHQWRAHIDLPDGSVHELYATFTITPWLGPDGTARGVIGVGFDVTDLVRAQQAAEEQAGHLRRRYEETRDVVVALQRELLPAGLPVLPRARIAASYLPADTDTAAGGDWFDAVPRPDGTVALIVGDVVGHGVAASGVMGQLRAVLHDRLDHGEDVSAAVATADRLARRVAAAHAATICVAVLDPADGTLTYCTAGHPPPLVVTAGGDTRFLPGTGGRPLGTGDPGPAGVRSDRLSAGDLIVLYSDGILERPGRDLAGSTAELARVAADSAAGRALRDPRATPAERVCAQTVELLVRGTGHTDDITVLAAQLVEPVPDLRLDLPAEAGSLRLSRAAAGEWLDRLGVTEDDAFLMQHALGELTTNAVEHGSGGRPVELRATLTTAGRIEATVTDHGRWREPARESHRGRGLALTAQLVDSLHVDRTEGGTTVTVRHAPSRPARMLTGAPAAPPAAAPASFQVLDDGDGHLTIEGPVDAATAPRLQQELMRRGRGGALPLLIDLTRVSHLASAGVSALHRVADVYAEQGGELTLYAAAGTPARRILELVALPAAAVLQPGPAG